MKRSWEEVERKEGGRVSWKGIREWVGRGRAAGEGNGWKWSIFDDIMNAWSLRHGGGRG